MWSSYGAHLLYIDSMVLLSKDKFMICLHAKTNKKSISNTKDKELEKEKEKHMLAFYMQEGK